MTPTATYPIRPEAVLINPRLEHDCVIGSINPQPTTDTDHNDQRARIEAIKSDLMAAYWLTTDLHSRKEYEMALLASKNKFDELLESEGLYEP